MYIDIGKDSKKESIGLIQEEGLNKRDNEGDINVTKEICSRNKEIKQPLLSS